MKTKNCCGSSATCGNDFCGCCEGTEILTPLPTANRPGLSSLSYRIGTHASFLETMKARLASKDYPELAGLTARDSSDPSIALLDAWATVADVLTFYQERIANEGYLRTATERRSVLELGRLTGYKMRPGVSSSVFLVYTLDPNSKEEIVIPAGSRAQSVPGKDELPQTFESSEDLKARSGWNNLRPRMTQPQTAETIKYGSQDSSVTWPRVFLKGINTNLKPNDPLLIDFGVGDGTPKLHWIKEVKPDEKFDRTLIILTRRSIAILLPENVSVSNGDSVKFDRYATLQCNVVNVEDKINMIEVELSPAYSAIYSIPELQLNDKISITPKNEAGDRRVFHITDIKWDPIVGGTILILKDDSTSMAARDFHVSPAYLTDLIVKQPRLQLDRQVTRQLTSSLIKQPSLQPANRLRIERKTGEQFAATANSCYRILTKKLGETLATATANTTVSSERKIKIYALRKQAAPFGHNAPLRPIGMNHNNVMEYDEWAINADSTPVAFFIYENQENSTSILFKNTSTPTNLIESVIWFFGDSKSSGILSGQNVLENQTHSYLGVGLPGTKNVYTVTLVVTGQGGTSTYTKEVTITTPALISSTS